MLQSTPDEGGKKVKKREWRKIRTFCFLPENIRFKKEVPFRVSDPQDMLVSSKKEVQLTQITVMFEQSVN